jgi:hypothetical protein
MARKFPLLPVFILAFASLAGCATSSSVDVVDLNKVLDALVAVLDEDSKEAGEAKLAASDANNPESTSETAIPAIDPAAQDPTKQVDFLKRYAAKLNELKVMSSPVGVAFTQGGEIIGFKDPNQNEVQDDGETKEFSVTVDAANSRLIASDNEGYHRPYGYRPGGGFLTGYLIGSMLGRQNSFYSGGMAAARPNFTNTPMSAANYHSQAVSSARSKVSSSASSARVRTGSKGFSFGK